jgi:hypothetical protein
MGVLGASRPVGQPRPSTAPADTVQLHAKFAATLPALACASPGMRTWSSVITLALATRCARAAAQESANLFGTTRIAIGAVRPQHAAAAV